jgi:hypothetical protein
VFSRDTGTAFAAYASPVGTDAWRLLPGVSGAGQAARADLGVSAGTGYVISSHAPLPGPAPVLLTGPADGSARWQRHALPCPSSMEIAVTAATGPGIIVACAGIGFHPTPTRVYRSVDGGRSWHQVPTVDDSQTVQGGGVVTAVMVTNDLGFAVVTGHALWLTHDGGQTWSGAIPFPLRPGRPG